MAIEDTGKSIRSLGDKTSENYIGVSDKTIFRALKTGTISVKTIIKLSDIIDPDDYVCDGYFDVLLENEQLKVRVDRLERRLKKLEEAFNNEHNASI